MIAVQQRGSPLVPREWWSIRMRPDEETLGQVLTRLRLDAGLTQEEVAAQLDPAHAHDIRAMKNLQSLLSRYESDIMKRPNITQLNKLEAVYGLPENTLVMVAVRDEQHRARRERVPGESVAIPAQPAVLRHLEEVAPLEDDQLELLTQFARYVRESDVSDGGMTAEERIDNYRQFLESRKASSSPSTR